MILMTQTAKLLLNAIRPFFHSLIPNRLIPQAASHPWLSWVGSPPELNQLQLQDHVDQEGNFLGKVLPEAGRVGAQCLTASWAQN